MEITDPIASLLNQKPGTEIWSVAPGDTVLDAIKLMAEKNVGAMLVMDGDKLVGIVSERDYTRKVILQGRASKDTPVRDIMTAEVVSISPSTAVQTAMALITNKRIRHLPIVDAGRVVGIVSIGDLVKRIMSAQETMIEDLENYVTGSYPG